MAVGALGLAVSRLFVLVVGVGVGVGFAHIVQGGVEGFDQEVSGA